MNDKIITIGDGTWNKMDNDVKDLLVLLAKEASYNTINIIGANKIVDKVVL
jgi:hypothetical protein